MKRLAALAPPGTLLGIGCPVFIVAGLWVLLGLGAGLIAAGIACYSIEWRFNQ